MISPLESRSRIQTLEAEMARLHHIVIREIVEIQLALVHSANGPITSKRWDVAKDRVPLRAVDAICGMRRMVLRKPALTHRNVAHCMGRVARRGLVRAL